MTKRVNKKNYEHPLVEMQRVYSRSSLQIMGRKFKIRIDNGPEQDTPEIKAHFKDVQGWVEKKKKKERERDFSIFCFRE